MNPPRILILYITPHSGHHCAAIAVQKAISHLKPGIELNIVDAFNYTNPILNKIVHKTYLQVIKRRPEVWEYLYDNPKVVLKVQKFKALIHKYNSRKLFSLFSEFKPDIVVCTQAFPCGMVADLKKHNKINIPIVGVITDYVTHSFWYYNNVDLYMVPDESTKEKMIQNGILEEKVKVHGIPIAPKFNSLVNREQVLENLGLDKNLMTVLIMGGGRGLGQIRQIVLLLNKLEADFQIMVMCGVNRRLFKYLKRKELRLNKVRKIKVFKYVDNMHELMAVSNILISKPGGITTAEALARKLPAIIFNPLPGQEKSNTEFLLNSGAAIKCDNITDLNILVKDLLDNPDKLTFMSQRAQYFGHPDSSLKIVSEIFTLVGNYV
ncbi:MAG: glycosyltransferase [Candidatus Saelkia tenebricola]|nr:glycosyltransferase [Candidatus Saelkia tenebricola]